MTRDEEQLEIKVMMIKKGWVLVFITFMKDWVSAFLNSIHTLIFLFDTVGVWLYYCEEFAQCNFLLTKYLLIFTKFNKHIWLTQWTSNSHQLIYYLVKEITSFYFLMHGLYFIPYVLQSLYWMKTITSSWVRTE